MTVSDHFRAMPVMAGQPLTWGCRLASQLRLAKTGHYPDLVDSLRSAGKASWCDLSDDARLGSILASKHGRLDVIDPERDPAVESPQ